MGSAHAATASKALKHKEAHEKLDLLLDFIAQDDYKCIKEINKRKACTGKKTSCPDQALKQQPFKVKLPNYKLSKNKALTSKLQKLQLAISPSSKIRVLALDEIRTISNLACKKGHEQCYLKQKESKYLN